MSARPLRLMLTAVLSEPARLARSAASAISDVEPLRSNSPAVAGLVLVPLTEVGTRDSTCSSIIARMYAGVKKFSSSASALIRSSTFV